MSIRIHELHPILAHFPLALLPTALAADVLGRVLRKPAWTAVGRKLMPIAAASATVTAASGLVAQEAVNVEGPAHDLLITHRSLNVGLLGILVALAAARARRTEPGSGYLLAGLGALGVMTYTAYLGGKMVYDHGVGVEAADGVRDGEAPEIRRDNITQVARTSVSHVAHALEHALEHAKEGKLAPALGRNDSPSSGDSAV